jgi:hypothetical protein
MSSMPSEPASSMRLMNGETRQTQAFAASRSRVGDFKVTLARIPPPIQHHR